MKPDARVWCLAAKRYLVAEEKAVLMGIDYKGVDSSLLNDGVGNAFNNYWLQYIIHCQPTHNFNIYSFRSRGYTCNVGRDYDS